MKASTFLRRLPEGREIPRVKQLDLLELYEDFTKTGVLDTELLDEIESRLLARAQIWIDLNNLGDLAGYFERHPEENPKYKHLTAILEVGKTRISYNDLDVTDTAVEMALNMLDMDRSDAWNEIISDYNELMNARASKDVKRRMLAIDRFVSVAHLGGEPLIENFVENYPLPAEEFLNALSAGNLSLSPAQHLPTNATRIHRYYRRNF